MLVHQWLQQYQTEVRPYYQALFKQWQGEATAAGLIPKQMLDYLADLYPRGKQLRGALAVLGYELAGGKERAKMLQASVGLEVLETSVLIMDDVFDGDEMRRGVPTVHRQWEEQVRSQKSEVRSQMTEKMSNVECRMSNENQNTKYQISNTDSANYQLPTTNLASNLALINSTVVGFHLAVWLMSQLPFEPALIAKTLAFYSQCCIYTGFGEAMDIASSHQTFEEKKQSAAKIHEYKTIWYSAILPLKYGALLAGQTNELWLSDLEAYSRALGTVFQIQDDILGSFGDPRKTGKANDQDLKEGRWTILVEQVYACVSKSERVQLERILSKPVRSDEEVTELKQLMERYRVVERVRVQAQTALDKGVAVIPSLTSNGQKQALLKALLEFMVHRDH